MLEQRRAGRHLPAEQPVRARRGLGPAAAPRAAADHRQEAQVLRHRRLRGGRRDRHGRPHQHHHADLLLRHLRRPAAATRPSPQIKDAIEKTYGKRGEAVVQKNFAAVDHDAGPPARGRRCPAQATSTHRDAARRVRPRRPSSSRHVTARSSPATATSCRSARCRSTAPAPPAPPSGRSATSPSRSRSGTPDVCIQCGKCVAGLPARRHPRQGLRRRRAWPARPRAFKSRRPAGSEFTDMQLHPPGRARGLHRLRAVRRRLPGQEQERTPGSRPSTWRPSRRSASRSAANWDFFLEPARDRPRRARTRRRSRTPSSCSRCSSSPAPAPAAARRPTSSC